MGTYKKSKKDGVISVWYENGQMCYNGTYKDGEVVNVIGKWDEDGTAKK